MCSDADCYFIIFSWSILRTLTLKSIGHLAIAHRSVMAKSVEDTAFYTYNRLAPPNEVGGDPRIFGGSVKDPHARNVEASRGWPHTLLASATHDTKRSEDVRTRINVLSEILGEWNAALSRWKRLNTAQCVVVQGKSVPDRNEEYLLNQTLLGAWPVHTADGAEFEQFKERIAAYLLKAASEAKIHTSWINPNQEYNAALQKFVAAILDEKRSKLFLEDISSFQKRVAFFGRWRGRYARISRMGSSH